MPLWQIFHPSSVFDALSKRALARDITSYYVDKLGLPAFYVVVQFFPLNGVDSYVGGQEASNFVRIIVHHLAFQSQGNLAAHKRIKQVVDGILGPHIPDRGLDFEYHVSESPDTMWKINGLTPPPFKSDDLKRWARENKATSWDGEAAA